MSPKATVLGSYRDADTGLQALKTIRRGGYHRSVALMHVQTGRTRVLDDDVLPGRAALAGAAAALAIVAVYMALVLGSLPTNWTEAGFLGALVITGALLGFAAGRILDFGINNNLIMTYRRWVLSNETLVIVQTPMERAQDVMTLLRRVERGQPATFVIRSLRPVPARAGEQIRNERFTTERMKAHAASLATRQSIRPRPGRTYPLVERALSSKRIVESVTADLTDGASLGQSVSTAAEWLLDNGYIVQRHIQDVLDNLSRGFYHVLPILQDGEEGERPRVHSLAEEVVAHTDCEVHEQDIVAFLDSYQEVSPLTIAELWAMPLMLRLALVENLSYLAIQVGRRQFQHERADFWANRLLSAARRSPDSMLGADRGAGSGAERRPPVPGRETRKPATGRAHRPRTGQDLVGKQVGRAGKRDDPGGADAPRRHPGNHRQHHRQPATALPGRLARDLRAGEQGRTDPEDRPVGHLPRDGFPYPQPVPHGRRGDSPTRRWPGDRYREWGHPGGGR